MRKFALIAIAASMMSSSAFAYYLDGDAVDMSANTTVSKLLTFNAVWAAEAVTLDAADQLADSTKLGNISVSGNGFLGYAIYGPSAVLNPGGVQIIEFIHEDGTSKLNGRVSKTLYPLLNTGCSAALGFNAGVCMEAANATSLDVTSHQTQSPKAGSYTASLTVQAYNL